MYGSRCWKLWLRNQKFLVALDGADVLWSCCRGIEENRFSGLVYYDSNTSGGTPSQRVDSNTSVQPRHAVVNEDVDIFSLLLAVC